MDLNKKAGEIRETYQNEVIRLKVLEEK